MPAHNQAWQQSLKNYQAVVTETELFELAGIPNHQTAEIFIRKFGLPTTPEELVTAKENFFTESLPRLQRLESVTSLVVEFHGRMPLGVVSGSPLERIHQSLKATSLESYFQCLVSCDDTARGKPFADPYLLGAQRLGVLPEHCLVFEDGNAGIESARAAGMKVICVKNGGLFEWTPA
jgi:HAD superfamily hydrolase (TIGR01509 family)